jgi:PhoD-like phosphatase
VAITAAAFGTGSTPGATTVSAPAPSGVALGDLLLVFVIDATSTVTFTISGSTGWSSAGPSTGQNIAGVLFYKNADSTDVTLSSSSGSYTLTPSASHSTEGVVIHAPGCSFDPSAPANAGQYAANATGSSFAATGVTTTVSGDTLVLFGAARSASGTPSTITLASGFSTLLAQANSSAGAAANVGVITGTETQATAGATGSQTNTTAAATNGGSFLFALSSGSATAGSGALSGSGTLGGSPALAGTAGMSGSGTLSGSAGPSANLSGTGTLGGLDAAGWLATLSGQGTLNGPKGLRSAATVTTGGGASTLSVPAQPCAVNDLIFIWVSCGTEPTSFTADPSFTAESALNTSSPPVCAQLFHKIADSTDVALAASSGSYTITQVTSGHPFSGAIGVVPVTDTVHPFDPSDTPGSGQGNASGTTASAASVTTAASGDLLVYLGANKISGGGVPPTMTLPAGYTFPPGVSAQANSSGTGTPNAGVIIGQSTQGAAGATGATGATFSPAEFSIGLLLAIKAAPVVPIPGTVGHLVAGAPTSSGFQVVAKTVGATSVRLAYSTSASMTSPSFVSAQTPDSLGYVRYTVSGLASHTQYYYQLMDTPSGGIETAIGNVGQSRTLPPSGSAQSFTVALVSCIAEQDTTTPPALDVAMSDWNGYAADLNIFTGDFDYSGTTSTDTPTQVGIFEQQIATYGQLATMVSQNWGYYCRSDHEAGPDNGDSDNAYTATNIAAAQQVFPQGVLGDTVNTPVHGLYQTWVVGRVRFIMIDIRNTDRSPGSNTDNSSKTMLGATQLAWLEAQLIQPEPLKVIISDVAWMGPATITNGPDKWWSYDTERQAILAYIAANAAQVQGLMLWHGDTHLVGCTPGTANAYGGFPVYCAAPLLNVGGGLNTSTFTHFYNNSGGECRLYGRISITDTGSSISVNFQGWDAAAGVAQVQQTDVFPTTAPMSGSGTLGGTPAVTQPGSGTLSGTGTLGGSPYVSTPGALSGSGTLSGPWSAAAPAALSGSGTLAGQPILTLFNNFEGLANGTTLTTANTGGASGNAFDSVNTFAGVTLAADNTNLPPGSTMALKVATTTTAGTPAAAWFAVTVGSRTLLYFRVSGYIPASATPAWRPLAFRLTSGTHIASVLVSGASVSMSYGSGFNGLGAFTTSVPIGSYFRVEGWVLADASAGQVHGELYRSVTATTPDEQHTYTALATGAPIQRIDVGNSNSAASDGPFWLDDVGISSLGPLGPAVQLGTNAMSGTGTLGGVTSQPAAGPLSGQGTLGGLPGQAAAGGLSGSGTLGGAGQVVQPGSGSMSGSGTLSSSPALRGAGSMSGSGTLAGLARFAPVTGLAGVGTLNAAAQQYALGVLSGLGTLGGQGSVVVQGGTGTADWEARPALPRWQAVPARPRWQAGPLPPRWEIAVASFAPISALSLEEINVTWTSDLDGTAIDPTVQPLVVQFAVPVSSGVLSAPAQPVTWFTASWLAGGLGKGYVAQCLVGPGAGTVVLVSGQRYDVWSKILGSPEQPAKFAGVQAVY